MGNNFAAAMPAAKFKNIGDVYSGTVVETRMVPVPEFDAEGKPSGLKFDEAGAVVMRPDVVLDTRHGVVVIHTGGGIFFALGSALAEKGASDLEKGDKLAIEYIGDGEAEPGLNAPKLYNIRVALAN
jgi:hypothetical protein